MMQLEIKNKKLCTDQHGSFEIVVWNLRYQSWCFLQQKLHLLYKERCQIIGVWWKIS